MEWQKAKIALVFDWQTSRGGAEQVNLALAEMFPSAPIYTSIFNEKNFPEFKNREIHTSFIQKLPFAKTKHQYFLDLMPLAYENFDLSEYDIVISSSHACAKGIITKPNTLHISYCHSPMRYGWDNWINYIETYNTNWLFKQIAKIKMHKLRMWDRLSADRVDTFIANSSITKSRIQKYYRKESEVIFPPVNTKNFQVSTKSENYFLSIGRLTSYKKFDLVVDTFNKIGLPLKIVGTGIEESNLKKMANSNIEILGFVTEQELTNLYANCQAVIFPQTEDFGIVPLEAMSSGKPVIAFKAGGALDTIIADKTGIFFEEQEVTSLTIAIEKFLKTKKEFDPKYINQHAQKFSKENFQKNINAFIEKSWNTWTTQKKD